MKTIGIMAVLLALTTSSATAQAPEKADTKIVLDFAYQGMHMGFTRGVDGGHYKREGLNVAVDRGYGSGDTVTKIASRTYDFGFADMNALVKFNAEHPEARVISVFQLFDRSLAAAIALKSSGIAKPQDLAGKSIAGSEGEGSRLLFPTFAKLIGIDASSVQWITVASNLREAMVVKKQAQAMTGFASTAFFNLKATGVPEGDITVFPYADFGLDLYGNTVIVREDFAVQNPNMVAAFVRGTLAGMIDAMKDPVQGIASLKKRDSLMKDDLELDRYKYVAERSIRTANVRQNGLGTIDKERLTRSIGVVAASFGVQNPPPPEKIATDRFLPPRDQRMVP